MLKKFKLFSRSAISNKNKIKGGKFEDRVAKMLNNRLCFNIKQNVILKDKHGNISEIDLVYGIFFKTYVECKCYDHFPVPLKDVAKFKEVLALNNIGLSRGLFITSNYFVPRATTIGVRTVDGDQLRRMELRSPFIGILKFVFIISGFVLTLGASALIFAHYKRNFEEGRRNRNID